MSEQHGRTRHGQMPSQAKMKAAIKTGMIERLKGNNNTIFYRLLPEMRRVLNLEAK